MEQPTWHPDPPTEPGWYWFYGWYGTTMQMLERLRIRNVDIDTGSKLTPVQLTMNDLGFGEFDVFGDDTGYKAEQFHGVWMPMQLPDPPTVGGD